MFEKLISCLFRHALILSVVLLAACKPEAKMADIEEINLDTYQADTKGWSDYCMGYNTLMLPPGMIAYWSAATHVDFHYPQVARNYPGTAMDYIKSHSRYGLSTFATKINGWEFVVAKARIDDSLISDTFLQFYGARKVGNDVLFFKEDASIDRVGDGTDSKYRAFYERLSAEPVTKRNRHKGFCYDGYVFSGYTPKLKYDFWADFGLSLDGSIRHSYTVNLSQRMTPPKKDTRPLAPPDEAAEKHFNEIFNMEDFELKKFGNGGGMKHLSAKDKDYHILRTIIGSQHGDMKHPVIYAETFEKIGPMSYEEGQKEFLSFLSAIQPN